MKLTRKQIVEAAATVYEKMVAGTSEAEIMDELGVDAETYKEVRRFMLEERSQALREQPHDHTFLEYVINQRRNLSDLDDLIKNLDTESQYNAIVGAIRLRADIHDRIINRGQEFGLIKKVPDRKELVGGFLIAEMSADDLRTALAHQAKEMSDLIKQFGEGDIKALPTGSLHYGVAAKRPPVIETDGSPIPPGTEGRSAKAKTAKRFAGRRRTRGDD